MMRDTELLREVRRAQRPAMERLYNFEESIEAGELAVKGGEEEIRELLHGEDGGRAVGGEKTLFSILSNSLVKVINKKRNDYRREEIQFLDIWPSYNSIILSDNWEEGKIIPKRVNIRESYHWNPQKCEEHNTEKIFGPVSHWFYKYLNKPINNKIVSNAPDELFPPSIHKYMVSENIGLNDRRAIVICGLEKSDYESGAACKEGEVLARDERSKDTNIEYIKIRKSSFVHIKECLEDILKGYEGKGSIFSGKWNNIKDLWCLWYAMFIYRIFYDGGYGRIKIQELKRNAIRAVEDESDAIDSEWYQDIEVRSMSTIRIRVPSTENELGSVMIFSDKVLGRELIEIIENIVWPIFSHLRQIERRLVGYGWLMEKGVRSAIASIMARNASHNAGSHSLSHLIDGNISRTYSDDSNYDDIKKAQTNKFLRYLKGRMDFVAEITTYWREMPWLEQ